MGDATIVYTFLHPSQPDPRISVDQEARTPLAEWLRDWRKAEPTTVAGIGLARADRWEGRDKLQTLAVEVRWEDYRFLIKPDVAKSWAEDLDAGEPGHYDVLPYLDLE
jgi:hypothetical protein